MASKNGERAGGAAQGKSTRSAEKSTAGKDAGEQRKTEAGMSRDSGNSRTGEGRSGQGAAQGGMAEFNKGEAVSTLNNLLIVDYDAVGLYDRVIQNLDNTDLRRAVEGFRGDHERHIRDLTNAIRELGGEPMSRPSLMGPIAKVVASIASTLMGNKGALQALMQGEQYTNASYREAAIGAFPEKLRNLVARNASDEERHLQWVTETLARM